MLNLAKFILALAVSTVISLLTAVILCQIINGHILWRYGIEDNLSVLQIWTVYTVLGSIISFSVLSTTLRVERLSSPNGYTTEQLMITLWISGLAGWCIIWGIIALVA